MIKNITRIEHKIGDRVYHLLCDADSPLNEVKDVLCHFIACVNKVEEAAKEAAAQQEQQAPAENAETQTE